MKTLISYANRIEIDFPSFFWNSDLLKRATALMLALGTINFDYGYHYELRDREITQEKISFVKMLTRFGTTTHDELSLEIISRKKSASQTYKFSKSKRFNELSDPNYYSSFSKLKLEKRLLKTIPKQFHSSAKYFIRPILNISEKYQIDPFWVVSIIWTESHFKSRAKSHVGASGLMQIMPSTQKYLLKLLAIKDIKLESTKNTRFLKYLMGPHKRIELSNYKRNLQNIELGVFYLKRLLHLFQGNHKYATVAYNMGPTWTLKRLRQGLPVGNKNLYINKVSKAYGHIDGRFSTL